MLEPQELDDTTSIDPLENKINVVEEIEKIALEKKIDVITAAIEFAKKIDWDPAWIAPYISGPLKEKLKVEGENQGLLKKSGRPKVLFE
jgi:hypothetical protein